ncbi:MAG: hypothetical protein NTX17_02190 [Candidatus Eisenbacteria bacterium]|nr:hypothetical protein [Candidatus Eisenbacteria bacterium]
MRRPPLLNSVAVLFVFLLSSADVVSGAKAGPAFPRDNYVAGWVRSERTLRFERSNLFDYIDGGAELFLEFGFDVLLVQRYKESNAKGDDEIALEIYQMESAEAALGIYLTKCGKETPVGGIKERNSGDRYQFSIVKGDCFIQVNNFGGDGKLMPVMLKLTQRTLASIPKGPPVTLLSRLPEKDFISGSGLIFRGPYALQSIFTFGSGDVLQLRGNVFGVTGDYAGPEGGVYTRLLILYPEPKAALSAFENLSNNLDPYLEVVSRLENGFTFRDYRDKFGTVELKNDVMEIKINLPEKPETTER